MLRPDDPDFRFERYFECDFTTGELRPTPTASPEEQARALRTIDILDLNRVDTCKSRLRTLVWLRRMPPDVWQRRVYLPITDDVSVAIPSIEDLILTKKFAARPRDADDVRWLEELRAAKP